MVSGALLAELQRVEQARIDAVLRGDAGLLATFLHEDLTYTHSISKRDSRDSLLAAVSSGAMRYLALEHAVEGVVEVGEAVIATGSMRGRVMAGEQEHQIDTVTTCVWVKAPNGWKLASFHASSVQ